MAARSGQEVLTIAKVRSLRCLPPGQFTREMFFRTTGATRPYAPADVAMSARLRQSRRIPASTPVSPAAGSASSTASTRISAPEAAQTRTFGPASRPSRRWRAEQLSSTPLFGRRRRIRRCRRHDLRPEVDVEVVCVVHGRILLRRPDARWNRLACAETSWSRGPPEVASIVENR
jgi:hypothetical protein